MTYYEPRYGYPCDQEGCLHNTMSCPAFSAAMRHLYKGNLPSELSGELQAEPAQPAVSSNSADAGSATGTGAGDSAGAGTEQPANGNEAQQS